VRVTQTTPLASRAGSMISVCPSHGALYDFPLSDQVSAWSQFKSYRDWGTLEKPVQINHNAHPMDLAYRATANASITQLDRAANIIWLVNTSGVAQEYMLEYVYNWEIAGTQTMQYGQKSTLVPHTGVYTQAQSSVQDTTHPSPGSIVHEEVAKSATEGIASAAKALQHVVEDAGKGVLDAAYKVLPRAAGLAAHLGGSM